FGSGDAVRVGTRGERVGNRQRWDDTDDYDKAEEPRVACSGLLERHLAPGRGGSHVHQFVVLKMRRKPGGARLESTSNRATLLPSTSNTGALRCLGESFFSRTRTTTSTASLVWRPG